MGKMPESLQRILLTKFDIRPAANEEALAGMAFHSQHGTALFVATRQQLLDLAKACSDCAGLMSKPS